MMSQPVGKTLNDFVQARLAPAAFQGERFGKQFEMQIVTIAAAI